MERLLEERKKYRQHFVRSESDNRKEVSPLVSDEEFINNQLVSKSIKGEHMKKVRKLILFALCMMMLYANISYAAYSPEMRVISTFNANGTWHQDSNGWWFEYPDGTYAKNKWEHINNFWYYFNNDGYMLVGWQQLSGEWYYLEPSTNGSIPQGAMTTGWKIINGKKYYFTSDGRMLIEQSSKKTLSLKAYTDRYFVTKYGANYASQTLGHIQTPYSYTWDIAFTPSVSTARYNFPNLQCSGDPDLYCPDAIDSLCSNSTSTPYHHRNANKNLNYMKANIPTNDAKIKLALTSTPLCGVWTGHATGIYGVTFNLDSYSYITCLPHLTQNVHVRIMQHEIAHMFGAHDGSCISGQNCVMKGSFDNQALSIQNIWCDNCKQDIDRNAH